MDFKNKLVAFICLLLVSFNIVSEVKRPVKTFITPCVVNKSINYKKSTLS